MDNDAVIVKRRGALTEQLHVLVDLPTKDYIIGCATVAARESGYTYIRQGETIRELIDEAIAARRAAAPQEFDRLTRLGRSQRS